MKFNCKFFITFLLLLILEVLIALYIQDNFIRPYAGDILVIILLYFAIKSFFSIRNKLLPLFIFGFAIFIEILQYINIINLLNLENNRLARTIIGTTFDMKDIFCYFIGCLILFVYQIIIEIYYKKNIKIFLD